MSSFCLLRDPDNYEATDWDFLADAKARAYWLDHFEDIFESLMKHALERYGRVAESRIAQANQDFAAAIEQLRQKPDSLPSGKLNLIELDYVRDRILREHHLDDPLGAVKERANLFALDQYSEVVRTFHAEPDDDKWLHLIRGCFAGNLYDLGSTATMHMGETDNDFFSLMQQVKQRPWLVDDYDAVAERFLQGPPMPWAKAVIFVDNAGPDFVLGVMPLARELVIEGTSVVLAANERPSLNDTTAEEAVEIIREISVEDVDLAAYIQAGMLQVVSTGNDIPVIDLANVSDELNEAAADADLVVLEGMGRAIETNFDAEFSVDCLKVGLIKSTEVADRMGGELYDCVCKFTPAPESEQQEL